MFNMEKCAPKKPLLANDQSKTTVNTNVKNECGKIVLSKDERLVDELRTQIPDVNNIFNIHRRIGEGTFSNVFLASLKCHESVPEAKRKLFAVKHLIPTSHPSRVERELRCLLEIGGIDNVVGVELCLRRNGAVAFVMPYVPHDRFIDYFDKLNARELQMYMRNLVLALKRVHSFGIIHRDVKPSNFLHDRKNNKYLLVDFGLAQINQQQHQNQQSTTPPPPSSPLALDSTNKTAANADSSTIGSGAGSSNNNNTSLNNNYNNSTRKRKASNIDETENRSNVQARYVNVKRARIQDPSQNNYASHNENDNNMQHQEQSQRNNPLPNIPSPFKSPLKQCNEISTPKNRKTHYLDAALTRHIKSAVLGYSMNAKLLSQRRQSTSVTVQRTTTATPPTSNAKNNNKNNSNNVINPKNGNVRTSNNGGTTNTTPPLPVSVSSTTATVCYCYGKPTVCNICIVKKEIHASRAGTPGYRPPEVLLKYSHQTTAVDMWAIGVIMISILSHCYPFFKGADDFSALAEMITVFGDAAIRKTALQMSRQICISRRKLPLHLRKLCVRLRNNRKVVGSSSGGHHHHHHHTTSTDQNGSAGTTGTDCQIGGGGGGGSGVANATTQTSCDNCQQIFAECLCADTNMNMDFSNDIYPDLAYDLMARLLTINPKYRISAAEALEHPFLKQDL